MRRFVLLPLAALALACPAWASAPVDGWDQLKFGMTADQVRALPKSAWTDLVKLPVPGGLSTMDSKKPAGAFSEKFTVRLTFDGVSKLNKVDLVTTRALEARACDAFAHKVIAAAETSYGAFMPDQRMVHASPDGVTYENAGAQSRLLLQTTDSPDTGKTVIAVTRHAAGKALVQVSMNYNAPPIADDTQSQAYLCELHVLFTN